MIRTNSAKQLTLAEFDWPFETVLDKNNRWVKLSEVIPWDDLAESYYQGLPADRGRPTKEARLVIGAVIIKHKLCLSDVETVQQIQETPYLQYFVGLPGYQQAAPFAPSLFVEIRKRMGTKVFEGLYRAIVAAHEGKKPLKPSKVKPPARSQTPRSKAPDALGTAATSVTDETAMSEKISETVEPTHQVQLILDATVVEQAIRFPMMWLH
jgi:IS5 family transposase